MMNRIVGIITDKQLANCITNKIKVEIWMGECLAE